MTTGQKICELRKAKKWSQEFVADKIGVSRQAVSSWERDETVPDIDNFAVLSDLFSVTIDELVKPNVSTIESVENNIGQQNKDKKTKQISIICIITGAFIVGIICTLSAIIPSRLATEIVVHREDIVLIDPDADMNIPEEDILTSHIETKGLIPFLNTYYLHWIFIGGCVLIIYGVVSAISTAIKNKRKE